ncbi:TPA: hypothetical protein DCY65_04965 [Candidatus Acetothermia bacterium]|nr:hypothetical protein [Candidatus Acetothermia bacterium]
MAFLVGDAIGRSLGRPVALALWALAVAAVLISGTALFLIPGGPGAPGAAGEAYLLANLSLRPSEAAIARLGSEISTWPGVASVTFRFPGETDPIPVAQRSLLVRLAAPEARGGVEARLRVLTDVTGVEYREQASARGRVPPASRIGAVLALVGTLALSLWLGHRAVTAAARAWARELALLRTCGTSVAVRRAPFYVLGALVGLAGGAAYIGVCWALWEWGRAAPDLKDVIPSFPHVWGALVMGGLGIGTGLGVMGSIVATVAPSAHS